MKPEQKAPLAAYAAVAAVGLIVVSQSVGHDPLGLGRVYNSLDPTPADQVVVSGEKLQAAGPAATVFGTPGGRRATSRSGANATATSTPSIATTGSTGSSATTSTSAAHSTPAGQRTTSRGAHVAAGQTPVRHPAASAGHTSHQIITTPAGSHSGSSQSTAPTSESTGSRSSSAPGQSGNSQGNGNAYGHNKPGSSLTGSDQGDQDGQGDDSGDNGQGGLLPVPWTMLGISPTAFALSFTPLSSTSVLLPSDDAAFPTTSDPADDDSTDASGGDTGGDSTDSTDSTAPVESSTGGAVVHTLAPPTPSSVSPITVAPVATTPAISPATTPAAAVKPADATSHHAGDRPGKHAATKHAATKHVPVHHGAAEHDSIEHGNIKHGNIKHDNIKHGSIHHGAEHSSAVVAAPLKAVGPAGAVSHQSPRGDHAAHVQSGPRHKAYGSLGPRADKAADWQPQHRADKRATHHGGSHRH